MGFCTSATHFLCNLYSCFPKLEDARQQGQEAPEPDPDQRDLKEEDNAIEMSEDMEGKMHDLDPAGQTHSYTLPFC